MNLVKDLVKYGFFLIRSVKYEHKRSMFKPVELVPSSQLISFFNIHVFTKRTSRQGYSEEDQDAEYKAVNYRHLTNV